MNFALGIRPAADADADMAAACIARDSTKHALAFYDALEATYRQLCENPRLWPVYESIDDPRLGELRRRFVIGFPRHLIFYRITGDTVDVLRILHGSRGIPSTLFQELEGDH